MENKVTWEWKDILPKNFRHCGSPHDDDNCFACKGNREQVIRLLQIAEREGKVALNPPNEDDILNILHFREYDSEEIIAQAIFKRISGKGEGR